MKEKNDPPLPSRKGWIGLRVYLFCILGLVAALPVLVLGVIQVPQWEAKQLEDADMERRFAAETLVHGIGQIVDGHVRSVETLAGQVQARGRLTKEVLQPMITMHSERYGGFSFMYIAGPDAISLVSEPVLNAEGKVNAGTDYSSRDYYKEILKTGKTAISRVQIGKRSGVPNIQIAAPFWDAQGKMWGFVEGSLDLSGIQDLANRIIKGIPGLNVVVLDHEGRVVAHPDEAARKAVKSLAHVALFNKVSGEGAKIHTGVDERGIQMRASVIGMDSYGLNWTVAVYRPAADEQAMAAAARQQVLTIAGLALLTGLVLATFLAEGLARPIRKLADTVTAVGNGDFSQLPDMPHALTPREMAALQVEVRHMVEDLKDYTTDLEKKIEQRTEQVNKINRELESFMYSVTHDLKAPVISLYGMAGMLRKKCGDQLDEQGRHYLDRLMSNAGFMEQLITDLLNFSRIGKQEYREEALDAAKIVQESLDQCDSRIREGNVAIKVRTPLPNVTFDHTCLCKIFMNLISNAMKFMGDQPHPAVEIGGRKLEGCVEYYVKDNGIGIDPKYQDTVFKVFQRLKEVPVEGTGIGLAIVKKVIDRAGGRVWFESEAGKGTTFFFQIPTQGGGLTLGGDNALEISAHG